tara:strand:- start:231 stop:539 length:309 start_codon:yes stop_codon:yes gene_type:complete
MGDLVDLDAFRKQKEKEAEEKAKAEEIEDIEYMRYVLANLMESLASNPNKTGTLFYIPMTDDEYYSNYSFESGYDDEGYYESTWEWDGFNEEDYIRDPNEED